MKPGRYDVMAIVSLLVVWATLEWLVTDPLVIRSVRVALPVGGAGFPVMLFLYNRGLSGNMTDTMKAIGYNFGFKGAVLVVTPFIVGQFTTIHYVTYEFLLFFVLFSLSFLAIYHARESG